MFDIAIDCKGLLEVSVIMLTGVANTGPGNARTA